MLKVTTADIVEIFKLEIVCGEVGIDRIITKDVVYRPGLILAGFFDVYPAERVQILGNTELSFFESIPEESKAIRMAKLCTEKTPCIVITHQNAVPKELVEAAVKYNVPVLKTKLKTTQFASRLTNYLESKLAPIVTLHAELVDVYGIGVLIMGDSGVGKSEIALELVKRGHRLVADDSVEISQIENELVGQAPEILRHLLEVRGLGILNIMTMFGAGSVRHSMPISLVISLEAWDQQKDYERLGLDEEKMKIHDMKITKVTIPVSAGRNLAVITEVAAMNFRLKSLGINAAEEIVERIDAKMAIDFAKTDDVEQ